MRRRDLFIATGAVGGAAIIGGGLAYREAVSLDDYTAAMDTLRTGLPPDAQTVDLVRHATLAANGHNSQPWRFRASPGEIAILPDLTRRTPVVDPDDHHLFVSLGCAAENLAIAAASAGRATAPRFDPGAGGAIVGLDEGEIAHARLAHAIPRRQSVRAEYDGRLLTGEELRALEAAAAEPGVETLLVTDTADLAAIRDMVVAGNDAQMADPAFIRELRDWLRFSPQHAMETGDGLFSGASGNIVAPEWLGRRLFDMFFDREAENDKYARHVDSSAGIAVFFAARADPEHWFAAGRACQRFLLEATMRDVKCAFVNQPVEVPGLRQELASLLGYSGRRPDLVIRFGRGPALPFSPRRPVAAVLV